MLLSIYNKCLVNHKEHTLATHLGRLKIVTRRKEGVCRYRNCPISDRKLSIGEKVLVLTRMGRIKGATTIFYKSYHPDCFGPWIIWMCDQTPLSKDGRKKMELNPKLKEERALLVRERARILRALRHATPDNLESKVIRISELDVLIAVTGYPVIRYKGRRSNAMVKLDKFVTEVKERYKSEIKVPRVVWDQARDMGVLEQFREEMEKWRGELQDITQSQKAHFEDRQEDKEEE